MYIIMWKICDKNISNKKYGKLFISNEEVNQIVLEKRFFTSIKGHLNNPKG